MSKAFVILVRILVKLEGFWSSVLMWSGSERYAVSPSHIWVGPLTLAEDILVDLPNTGPEEVTARWLGTENFRRTRRRWSRVPVSQTPGKDSIVSWSVSRKILQRD